MNPDPLTLPLRDLHLPDPISWWPIAPGWWLLFGAFVFIALTLWGARWIRRRGRFKRQALEQFYAIEAKYQSNLVSKHQLTKELSILLRRLVISSGERAESAALTGELWMNRLDQTLEGTEQERAFSEGVGRVLSEAPYNPECDVKVPELLTLIRFWIEQAARQRSSG